MYIYCCDYTYVQIIYDIEMRTYALTRGSSDRAKSLTSLPFLVPRTYHCPSIFTSYRNEYPYEARWYKR